MTADYNATVTLRHDLTPGTMVIRVKPDGQLFSYEPGQYTVLGLRRSSPRFPGATDDRPELQGADQDVLIKRAYSITSNSADDQLEFIISLVGSGSLTPRLFNLKQGSRIYLEPKAAGVFTLQRSSGNRDLLLIATGSALAPYISMLRSQFPENQENQYVVLHAAAVSWDLHFRGQMEEFAARSLHFTYIPTITEPQRDKHWQGLTGQVEELLANGAVEDELGLPISPDRFDVFLSGSPQMIDAAIEELKGRGFVDGSIDAPGTNIHAERYPW